MKTPEELKALKEDVEALNKKLAELTEDELKQVAGGCEIICDQGFAAPKIGYCSPGTCEDCFNSGPIGHATYHCTFFLKSWQLY